MLTTIQPSRSSRYWDQIELGYYDFFHRASTLQSFRWPVRTNPFPLAGEHDATTIASLSKSDIITFFQTYIHPSSTRTKLSVLMRSQRLQPEALHDLVARLPEVHKAAGEALAASKPTKRQIVDFFNALGVDAANAIEEATRLPVLPQSVVEIAADEVDKFRSSLQRAEKVVPADNFKSDLLATPHL